MRSCEDSKKIPLSCISVLHPLYHVISFCCTSWTPIFFLSVAPNVTLLILRLNSLGFGLTGLCLSLQWRHRPCLRASPEHEHRRCSGIDRACFIFPREMLFVLTVESFCVCRTQLLVIVSGLKKAQQYTDTSDARITCAGASRWHREHS